MKPVRRIHLRGCRGIVRGWAHYGWCEKCHKIVPLVDTWIAVEEVIS